MMQIKKETANICEYKVEINANIANFVRLWKPRMQKCFLNPGLFIKNFVF